MIRIVLQAKQIIKLINLTKQYSVNNYMKTYQSNQITRHHGIFRVDQYQNFDKDEAEVQKFIEQENQIFGRQSKKWQHFTEQYYAISSSRRDNRSATIPQSYDNYSYFTKVAWKNGRQYSTIHRKASDQSQKQQLVLDIMHYAHISRNYKTVELLKTSFSPSHRYIAFGVDLKNNQKMSFYIVDTKSKKRQLIKIKDQSDQLSRIEDISDLIFTSENEIYYIQVENFRPCKIIYHNLSKGQKEEVLLEKDSQIYLNLRVSKDKKYLIISGQSKIKSKIWLMDLNSPKRQIIKVWEQTSKIYINHVQDHFIVWLQNQENTIKLIEDSEIADRSKIKYFNNSKQLHNFKHLKGITLYTCSEEESIQQIDITKGNITLYIHKINKPVLKVIGYQKNLLEQSSKYHIKVYDAALPYKFGVISPGTNQNYNTDQIIFNISTPFVYDQVYSYSFNSQKYTVIQKYEHTGPAISNNYHVQHINVPSVTMDYIPMTIIGPKKKNIGKLLIHIYGFYGISNKVTYDNVTIAALQKGWTVVYAHTRGGGEKGKKWHKEASGMNRDRTWKDLQECIGYLIKEEYTHPSLLFINTSSAGAIAAWNAINKKPHLYKGVILRFPFLDILTSLMDKSQPLSNSDYQQFGNPIESKTIYTQLQAISPYQNIQVKEYPAIHILAGKNDYRTPISQIAKFVSRYRDRALENNRLHQLGVKGVTVDISSTASHLGEASIKDENYKGCDVYGYMDYVIHSVSRDCSLKSQ